MVSEWSTLPETACRKSYFPFLVKGLRTTSCVRLYLGQHCDEERLREKRPISQEMVIAHFCQQALNAETLLTIFLQCLVALVRRSEALLHADEIVSLADLGGHLNVQLLTVVDVERLDHPGADRDDLMRFQAAVIDQRDFIRDPQGLGQLHQRSFIPADVFFRNVMTALEDTLPNALDIRLNGIRGDVIQSYCEPSLLCFLHQPY